MLKHWFTLYNKEFSLVTALPCIQLMSVCIIHMYNKSVTQLKWWAWGFNQDTSGCPNPGTLCMATDAGGNQWSKNNHYDKQSALFYVNSTNMNAFKQ